MKMVPVASPLLAVGAPRSFLQLIELLLRPSSNSRFLAHQPMFFAIAPCVGCDIVQADHAPEAGVAQGIFHGILVRHHGRIQEEVEEGLEDEVERHEEEENTQEQVRMPMTMDGNEDTQTRLEPQVTMYA